MYITIKVLICEIKLFFCILRFIKTAYENYETIWIQKSLNILNIDKTNWKQYVYLTQMKFIFYRRCINQINSN